MSKYCQISGKKKVTGHRVSHSNIKTKRFFELNLQTYNGYSEILGKNIKLTVCNRIKRTIEKYHGIDGFFAKVKNRKLCTEALLMKKKIEKTIKYKQQSLQSKVINI